MPGFIIRGRHICTGKLSQGVCEVLAVFIAGNVAAIEEDIALCRETVAPIGNGVAVGEEIIIVKPVGTKGKGALAPMGDKMNCVKLAAFSQDFANLLNTVLLIIEDYDLNGTRPVGLLDICYQLLIVMDIVVN